ncbi:uncharacterized protein LOC129599273 [Paramacrobiotus metropolitanus]|uniref:uncharacterized protein LOC129599273 n=1 Tax=Paramacrobiotus metropolitanus TaxID=2943436 RepID=UPI0024462B82|nr:uncharacterized protein LOC129599273 [Paramacrobiotus metropolitanus]
MRLCNINGISSKSDEVKIFCSGNDLIGLTETKDRPGLPDKMFRDGRSFNVFRRARVGRAGGGVALVVKKHLAGKRRSDLERAEFEFVAVEVSAVNIIVGVFCGAPDEISEVLPKFLKHLSKILTENDSQRFLLMGDFNCPKINWHSLKSNVAYEQCLLKFLKEFNLKQIVLLPTRKSNTLDLIIVPTKWYINSVNVVSPPASTNDHDGLSVVLCLPKIKSIEPQKIVWKFLPENIMPFRSALFEVDWKVILRDKKCSEMTLLIENEIISKALQFFNKVRLKPKRFSCSFPLSLKRAIRRRDTAHRRYVRATNEDCKNRLRGVWKTYSKTCDLSIRNFMNRKLQDIATASRQNPKKFWSYVRKSVDKQGMPILRCGDQIASTDEEKAEALNTHYSSALISCMSHCSDSVVTCKTPVSVENFVNETDIWEALKLVDISKSIGPFEFSNELIKICGSALIAPLKILFNCCLSDRKFQRLGKYHILRRCQSSRVTLRFLKVGDR